MAVFLAWMGVTVAALALYTGASRALSGADEAGRPLGPRETAAYEAVRVAGFGGAGLALYAVLWPILPI